MSAMKPILRSLSKIFWALFSIALTFALIIAIALTFFEAELPNVTALKDVHMQVPLRIYTADGKLMSQFGVKRRTPVTLDQVPKTLIHAVLATEDARFYEHHGVDPVGVARAAVAVIASGQKVQGASTITMQVARNFFLTKRKTYSRKLKEILLALKIDRELTKDKILELYLNKIYFGNRAYGVAAAAEVYYGVSLDQLTLPQMAMLAGLPQAPSTNNPITNPQAAVKRRNHVLARMLEVGYIDKATYEKAIKAPVTAKYHGLMIEAYAPYVSEMVREAMVDEYGKQAYEKGLSIYTTIDSTLQFAANKALEKGLMDYNERHGFFPPENNLGVFDEVAWTKALSDLPKTNRLQPAAVTQVNEQTITALLSNGESIQINQSGWGWARPALDHGYVGSLPKVATELVSVGDQIYVEQKNQTWFLSQWPMVQGAIVSLNPTDGAILALSGGFNYDASHFNRAIQAERQPGSNFKPFIYSAALEKGYTLATLINDAPIVQEDTGENALWRPTNDTEQFYGPTPLRIGLIKSRNLVSIRLLQQIGIPYALNYVQRFGFDPNALPNSLSLALGTGLVTPLEIASGYAVFANGGYHVQPFFIQEIDGENSTILFKAKPARACEKCLVRKSVLPQEMPNPMAPHVLTLQNAYLMTHVMRGVIEHGTGRAARVLKRRDLAGKTGTTNKQVDAWFSGFNSNVVTTVWVGFDNLRSLYEYGAKAALPIWIDYMRAALKGTPEATMPEPEGMITVRIDPETGLLAGPSQKRALFEVFRQQYAPRTYSANAGAPPAQEGADAGAASEDSSGAEDVDDQQHLF